MKQAKIQQFLQELLDKLIAKLELSDANLDEKLEELQKYLLDDPQFKTSYTTNSDLEKILKELETNFKQDFLNLARLLKNRFLQTNTNLDLHEQLQTWFAKDFANADKLYQREFAKLLNSQKYYALKNQFLTNFLFNFLSEFLKPNQIKPLFLQKNELEKSKSNQSDNYFAKILQAIGDFDQSFTLLMQEESSLVLLAKYFLLQNHSQIDAGQIVYLSILPKTFAIFSPKRHCLFDFLDELALNSIRKQLYDKDFFKKFRLDMNEFCNLPSMLFSRNSSFFGLDAKICFSDLEKLIADFLFLNRLEYQKFCTISKPNSYANFYLKKYAIEIFIESEFSFFLKQAEQIQIIELKPSYTKTHAYELLEQAFTNFGADADKFQPLLPDEVWDKTANLFEEIFVHQVLQILQIFWQDCLSFTELEKIIQANMQKIFASNSMIFLIEIAYKSFLQNLQLSSNSLNFKGLNLNKLDLYLNQQAGNFILLNSALNLDLEDKKYLNKLSKNNKIFSISNTNADFLKDIAQDELQNSSLDSKQKLRFFQKPDFIQVFNLEAIKLDANKLDLYSKDFFIAKLLEILQTILAKNTCEKYASVQKNKKTAEIDFLQNLENLGSLENSENIKEKALEKITIFVATKQQADSLKRRIKIFDKEDISSKIEFFYMGFEPTTDLTQLTEAKNTQDKSFVDLVDKATNGFAKQGIEHILIIDFCFHARFSQINQALTSDIFIDLNTKQANAIDDFYRQILNQPTNKSIILSANFKSNPANSLTPKP